jgi:hypothetical protein
VRNIHLKIENYALQVAGSQPYSGDRTPREAAERPKKIKRGMPND